MKKHLETLKASFTVALEKAKLRKGLVSIFGTLFVLQIYFVRELLAAELLFAMGFAVIFSIGLLCYLVGALGERGLDWTEAGVRILASSARRGYSSLEEVTRKQIREPRSESAQ